MKNGSEFTLSAVHRVARASLGHAGAKAELESFSHQDLWRLNDAHFNLMLRSSVNALKWGAFLALGLASPYAAGLAVTGIHIYKAYALARDFTRLSQMRDIEKRMTAQTYGTPYRRSPLARLGQPLYRLFGYQAASMNWAMRNLGQTRRSVEWHVGQATSSYVSFVKWGLIGAFDDVVGVLAAPAIGIAANAAVFGVALAGFNTIRKEQQRRRDLGLVPKLAS